MWKKVWLAVLMVPLLVVPGVVLGDEPVPGGLGPSIEQAFPGYEPKTSPDTVTDYRPALDAALGKLPTVEPEHLPVLVRLLEKVKTAAREHPGEWFDGHPGLGADPREYRPSDEELIAAEVGRRIESILAALPPGEARKILAAAGMEVESLEYQKFTFRHVDVMGSGRFFYASPPVKVTMGLD